MSSSAAVLANIVIENLVGTDVLNPNALVIDDEAFGEAIRNRLELEGFNAETVIKTEDAEPLLKEKNYHLIVADINFPSHLISGDEFIHNNIEYLKDSTTIAVSGRSLDRKKSERLTRLGIPFFEKTDIDSILTVAEQVGTQRKNQIQQNLTMMIKWAIEDGFNVSPVLLEQAAIIQKLLTNYLRSLNNADQKTIIYGGEEYSPNEIAMEIEKGSDVGKDHIRIMSRRFVRQFGMGK